MQVLSRIFSSSLFRAMSVYGATNALNRAIPFLMIPVFTRYLSPRDYGMISMFGVVLSIAAVVSGFGAINTLSLRYFQRDRFDLASYVGNCLNLLIFSTAGIAACLSLFGNSIERITEIPRHWLWAIVPLAFSGFITTALLYLLQSAVRPLAYGSFQILQTAGHIALSVWFVVVLGMNWQGRVISQVITTVLFAGAGVVVLHRANWLRWTWNPAYLKDALRYSVPLLPHALGGFVIDATDRLLITNMASIEDTGVYAVGSQVGMVMLVLTSSFNMAWVPWLFGRLRDADGPRKARIIRLTYAYNCCLLLLSLILAVCAPWIFRLFVGKDFSGGAPYVLWIALGYAFNGMYMMVANYIFYAEKTYLVSWVTFLSAIVNICASYLLIRAHGAIGAAQGAALAHLTSFLLAWFFSSRAYPMPWNILQKAG
jgi:O-antigen/teichoic acid export membrane protein